jgi:hypothetical protein
VQVDPLLPEKPDIPLLVAPAGTVRKMTAHARRPLNRTDKVVLFMDYSLR